MPEIEIYDSPAALADAAARRLAALASEHVAASGRFSLALSGGSTPRALHERLARPPLRDAIPWAKVLVFWGDERFVPPDHPDSNERMARETLLDHVPILPENLHPMPTVGQTPAEAAEAYGRTLRALLGDPPRLDLLLLGMGPDGHTASIFPGQPEAVAPGESPAIPVFDAPKPPPTRLSLSYRTINAARNVLLLVAGADKAAAVKAALEGSPDPARVPAGGVRPAAGTLVWMLDRAAAAELRAGG